MNETNAITTTQQQAQQVPPTQLARIQTYLEAAPIQKRFAEIMGERGAKSYVSSVLIAVADSKALQKCAPDSIYISALRAATLRLSVDSSIGQAYLVPFGGRATLIVGYKGLYDMAVRTNRYRYINVGPICQGQVVTEDSYTGWHKIDYDKSVPFDKQKTIGWLGAFQMLNGIAHTLYMTCEEIHEHARKYSKGYDNPDGGWQKEPRKMERKTVLRLLLRRWGFLDPADVQALNAIEEDEVVEAPLSIDNSVIEAAEGEDRKEPRTREQALSELGFKPEANPDPIDEKLWDAWNALCVRAEKVDVQYSLATRERMTQAELKLLMAELAADVEQAEAQAKSGE